MKIKEALERKKKFNGYEQIKPEENLSFIIKDAEIIKQWDGKYGTTDLPICLVEYKGKDYTMIIPGTSTLRQIRRLIEEGKLPGRIEAVLVKVESKDHNKYWMLI